MGARSVARIEVELGRGQPSSAQRHILGRRCHLDRELDELRRRVRCSSGSSVPGGLVEGGRDSLVWTFRPERKVAGSLFEIGGGCRGKGEQRPAGGFAGVWGSGLFGLRGGVTAAPPATPL